MAKAHLDSALAGISGRSGSYVFRKIRTGTVIAQRPSANEREPSAAQQRQREHFVAASRYTKLILADPWQRRAYEALARERGRRVDKLVTSDFLTPPVVDELDASEYRRRANDPIRVLASDDVEVVSVAIAIRTANGDLIEEGAATKTHGVWVYRTTQAPPAGVALIVTATAKDRPDHQGVRTVVVA